MFQSFNSCTASTQHRRTGFSDVSVCRDIALSSSKSTRLHTKAGIISLLSPSLPLRWRIAGLLCWEELLETWKKQISSLWAGVTPPKTPQFLSLPSLSFMAQSSHICALMLISSRKSKSPATTLQPLLEGIREEPVYLLLCDLQWRMDLALCSQEEQPLSPSPKGMKLVSLGLSFALPGNTEKTSRELKSPRCFLALFILREVEGQNCFCHLPRSHLTPSAAAVCLTKPFLQHLVSESLGGTLHCQMSVTFRGTWNKTWDHKNRWTEKPRCIIWYWSCVMILSGAGEPSAHCTGWLPQAVCSVVTAPPTWPCAQPLPREKQ